jgi:hypothetical protein
MGLLSFLFDLFCFIVGSLALLFGLLFGFVVGFFLFIYWRPADVKVPLSLLSLLLALVFPVPRLRFLYLPTFLPGETLPKSLDCPCQRTLAA